MTDHPCKGLGKAATDAFEQIATGVGLPPMSKGVAAKLLAKGLIDHATPKVLRDSMGNYAIPQYFVPLSVHSRWCEWCSEQPENIKAPRMTAQILPFPDRTASQSALDPATGADTAAAPGFDPPVAAAGNFLPRECPKVQEFRRNCKLWLERDRQFSGGTCSGGEG